MATIKKSKKKVIVPICIVLVIAIVAGVVFGVVKSNDGEEVTLDTISTGDIYEKVSLTGEVTAGTSKDYKVGTVATVKDVKVAVGDQVAKGDVLATFDTSSIDSQVASLQTTYDDAVKNYNSAVASQKSSSKKAKALKKEIDELDKKIKKLKKKAASTTAAKTTTTTTTAASTTKANAFSNWVATSTTTTATTAQTTTDDGKPKYTVSLTVYPSQRYGTVTGSGRYPQDVGYITAIAMPNAGYQFLGWYTSIAAYIAGENPVSNSSSWYMPVTSDVSYVAVFTESSSGSNSSTTTASISDIANTLSELNKNIASITNDVKTFTAVSQIVANSISNAVASGQLNSQAIANLVGKDIQAAITNGIVDSTKLVVESGVAVDMIKAAVSSIDYKALAKGLADSDNGSLTAAEIQRATLAAQYEIYKAESDSTIVDSQKTAVSAAEKALDAMKETQTELANGWTADFDGVITAVDINPDSQTTAISSGITLENHDVLVATVSLSEYDVHKVKKGMTAKVTTAYGEYEGTVATIAPTATGGSSSSIMDSVGSMAGISGLSSLTDSGAGVECTVEIKDPDENIIAGFDADVEIETGEYLGVTVVPIESITLEKTGSYVYLYNEDENTVTKTEIKTGAISDTAYEVTSGLKPGDKIVATPKADYTEDTFKVKVTDSTNK